VACALIAGLSLVQEPRTTRAIGPLGLEHLDPADDPRNTPQSDESFMINASRGRRYATGFYARVICPPMRSTLAVTGAALATG
jgi:hypothetical protein